MSMADYVSVSFTVQSKTETLKMDETSQFVLSGVLAVHVDEFSEEDGQALGQASLIVPVELFGDVETGAQLWFSYRHVPLISKLPSKSAMESSE